MTTLTRGMCGSYWRRAIAGEPARVVSWQYPRRIPGIQAYTTEETSGPFSSRACHRIVPRAEFLSLLDWIHRTPVGTLLETVRNFPERTTMSTHDSNSPASHSLGLRAGHWVEVRSADEILATLDDRGALDALPFMPEMLQYCGKRFRVFKRA